MENKFELVKEILKEEFFGIDEQIDQVIKAFETWLTIKDYQIRPITVCLWGLTGTGKTALINRSIELLDLTNKKFYIKFGSKTSRIDQNFEENVCEDNIFVLDEFQYFRTKKENGMELDRDEDNSTNVIWELLDGGIINLYGNSKYYYGKLQISSVIYTLQALESNGAKYIDGIIQHSNLERLLKGLYIQPDKEGEVKLFKENYESEEYPMKLSCEDIEGNPEYKDEVSKTEIRINSVISMGFTPLYDYVRSRDINYNFISYGEFYGFIRKMNDLSELIKFFKLINNAKLKPDIRDYTKSLIFVLGNLDECFTMSTDLNSDLDADYFYKKTKSINIIDIRKALLKRFRSEQIARLGSTHIIYPSLNKEAFKKIIDKELNSFKDILHKKFENENITISDVIFSEKIKDLIYREGVFPIIGARSVFSIVNEIVSDKLSIIVKDILSFKETEKLNIVFDYTKKDTLINIKFIDLTSNKLIKEENCKYFLKVDNLRNEKDKGKQTHRAVHEAGHAVCSVVLEHSFPEVIYSVTINDKTGGFNLLNSDDMYYDRKNTYSNRIASLLAGFAAEKIIFGDENVSTGSGSDISKATSFACSIFKDSGFSEAGIGKFISPSYVSSEFINANYTLANLDNSIDKEVYSKLQECLELAINTLNEQKTLFLKISEYLVKNPKMTNKKIKELTKKYLKDIDYQDIISDKQDFYTKMLNDNLKNIDNEQ